jgi:hypothetical protein
LRRDHQNKYSIRLPAPAWKVYRDVDFPEPSLAIANPNWEQRLEVHVRALPIALEMVKQLGEAEAKKTGTQPLKPGAVARSSS